MVPLRGPLVSASGNAWSTVVRMGQAARSTRPAHPATAATLLRLRGGTSMAYRRATSTTMAPAVAVPSSLICPATATPMAATPRFGGVTGRNRPNTTANAAANTQGASANPLVRYRPAEPAAARHSKAATTAALMWTIRREPPRIAGRDPAPPDAAPLDAAPPDRPARYVTGFGTWRMAAPRATSAHPFSTPMTIWPRRYEAALPAAIPLTTQPTPDAAPSTGGKLGSATVSYTHLTL